jgi:type II secretory pathway component PulF
MTRNLALAYHNLSIMLEAGIPVFRAFTTTAQTSKGRLRHAFSAVAQKISKGESLVEAMLKYPKVFAPLDITLIEAADLSGKLPESLMLLSRWYDFRRHLRGVITSGLMLPFVLINVTAFIGPLPALLLGKIGLIHYIIEAIGTLALFYLPFTIILAILRLTPSAGLSRRLLDAFTLRIPLLGRAVRQLALTRFCRVFNMLYKVGVPITQSAQKATGLTGNWTMTKLLKGGAESAQAGNMVCDGFSNKLPIEFLSLWRIGEETGELDNTVNRLADTTGQTAERLLFEFSQWLPRVIYWLVSIVIIIQIFRGAAAIGSHISTQL